MFLAKNSDWEFKKHRAFMGLSQTWLYCFRDIILVHVLTK